MNSLANPNRETVSFRSCVRAGEAKLCGPARGDKIVQLGLLRSSFVPTPAAFPCPRGCPQIIPAKSPNRRRFRIQSDKSM